MEKETDEELQTLLNGVDEFAKAMKERLIAQSQKGRKGWQEEPLEYFVDQARDRLERIENEQKVDIGIANFMMMHWLNRQL